MELNSVQRAAYELIQSDARFIYSLFAINKIEKHIHSNYVMMSQPFIGMFTNGADQWCKKMGISSPQLSDKEEKYYTQLRLSHKLYELPYTEYLFRLINKLNESDLYFYNNRSLIEKIVGYYNVGVDISGKKYVGNTILCSLYVPTNVLDNKEIRLWIRDISVIVGKLSAFFGCLTSQPYAFNKHISASSDDFHFYNSCPIKVKNEFGFLLFSLLCSINYALVFINQLFDEDIPQKFKLAYLQYYYLCDFVTDMNRENNTHFYINPSLKNRQMRNCLSHYGLGQYIREQELYPNDPLKGLTIKAFDLDYKSAKKMVYLYLSELTDQIERYIF